MERKENEEKKKKEEERRQREEQLMAEREEKREAITSWRRNRIEVRGGGRTRRGRPSPP